MDTILSIQTIGALGTVQYQVPIVSYARVDYYIVSGTDGPHRSHHLNVHCPRNYRGEVEGSYFSSRLATRSTTVHGPEGDYLYLVVSDYDLHRMLGAMYGETMITTILHERQNYDKLNMHFCMRDSITHYMALVESGYETDTCPHALCLKVDYKSLLMEDTNRDPKDRHYATFNRHYMEYSMFALRDITKVLSPVLDYDHYQIKLPTVSDYISVMTVPVYFDYTSAVTKHHILSNPHLVSTILCSPSCFKLFKDWEDHYQMYLGELLGYVTKEIFEYMAKAAIRVAEDIDRTIEADSRKSKR